LQGFLPLDPPPGPPFARFLQPKCLGVVGTGRDSLSFVVIDAVGGVTAPNA